MAGPPRCGGLLTALLFVFCWWSNATPLTDAIGKPPSAFSERHSQSPQSLQVPHAPSEDPTAGSVRQPSPRNARVAHRPATRAPLVWGALYAMGKRQRRAMDWGPLSRMLREHRDAPAATTHERATLWRAGQQLNAMLRREAPRFRVLETQEALVGVARLCVWEPVLREFFTTEGSGTLERIYTPLRHIRFVRVIRSTTACQLVWALGSLGIPGASKVMRHMGYAMLRGNLTTQDVVTAAVGFSRMGRATHNTFLALLAAYIINRVDWLDFTPQGLTNVAWAYTYYLMPRPRLFAALAYITLRPGFLERFTIQDVAGVAWAFAKCNVSEPRLFEELAVVTWRLSPLEGAAPRHLATLAWAFAKVRTADSPELVASLADRVLIVADSPRNLATTVWACARVGVLTKSRADRAADRLLAARMMKVCNTVDVVNVAWAFASLGPTHDELFQALATRCLDPGFLNTFRATDIATLAMAFATVKARNVALMDAIAGRALHRDVLPAFGGPGLVAVVCSFATFGLRRERLLTALTERLLDNNLLQTVGPTQLAALTNALALLDFRPPTLEAAIARSRVYREVRAADPAPPGSALLALTPTEAW